MWLKISEKHFLNMDFWIDITACKINLYLQGMTPDMYLEFRINSPETKVILAWLEDQEKEKKKYTTEQQKTKRISGRMND